MLNDEEKKKLKYSMLFPSVFILFLWIIKLFEEIDNIGIYRLGVYPREISGLPGILFSPFIHGDFNHLFSNTGPLFILGTGIIYFYRELAYKVVGFVWIISGFCVWFGARDSYHIGASGLIYGLASFLFFSGIIRKDIRLSAISLLVVFLYGSMIWGIFPGIPKISWEFHFFGGLSGLIAAIIYRKEGPKTKEWNWDQEEEELSDEEISEKPNDL